MHDKPLSVTIQYYLSEHPNISGFTWSPTQSWGSTWSFLVSALALYAASATALHLLLRLATRRRVPLGPVPALHSLAMCALSVLIFAGTIVSASADIRDTRWLWRQRRTACTPVQWLLCFPLGTRPSGRVFFWSYMFYLSRLLMLPRTFFEILRSRRLSAGHVVNQSLLILMSFLWLEYSQSFQVPAVAFAALVHSAVHACRFCAELRGTGAGCKGFVAKCRVGVLWFNAACHVGVLVLQFAVKGGCNGIGAWLFNSVLNAVILLLFLKYFYGKDAKKRVKTGTVDA